MNVRLIAFAILALVVTSVTHAGIGIALPLDGFYRAGRYFPVSIDGAGAGNLTVTADGVVPTQIEKRSSESMITPVLSIGTAIGKVRVGVLAASQNLQALAIHDSLVGVAGGTEAEAVARTMFPGSTIVIVHLDPADPLPGPPIAWQSLDGIVLSERWPGGLSLEKLPAWLSGGMTVGVAASQPPDQQLPWRPVSGGWVLRPNIAGPLGCDGNEDAYSPSMTWHPDLSANGRWRIVGAAGAIILLLLLTALLPKRARYGATAVIAILGIAIPARPADSFRATGEIEVARIGWEQRDRWTYFAGSRATPTVIPLDEESWPVFSDPLQAGRLNLILHDEGGRQSLGFSLPANNRLAVLQRRIRPASAKVSGTIDQTSPMGRLAQTLYRDAGDPHSSAGDKVQSDDPNPTWPTISCTSR